MGCSLGVEEKYKWLSRQKKKENQRDKNPDINILMFFMIFSEFNLTSLIKGMEFYIC